MGDAPVGVGQTWAMISDYDDPGSANLLSPSESLDSDEVRNDDGDIVVDPPERWIEVHEDHTLDEKLAAEEPDGPAPGHRATERPTRAHRGQIDGSPEDGDSFYVVVNDDE